MSSLDRFIYELQAHTSRHCDADPQSHIVNGTPKEPSLGREADSGLTSSVTDTIAELLAKASNSSTKTLPLDTAPYQSAAGNIYEKQLSTLEHLCDHLETVNSNKDGLRQELKQQSRAARSMSLNYNYLGDFTSMTKLMVESACRGDPQNQLQSLNQDTTWTEFITVTGNTCQELQAMEQHLNSVAGDFSQLSKLSS